MGWTASSDWQTKKVLVDHLLETHYYDNQLRRRRVLDHSVGAKALFTVGVIEDRSTPDANDWKEVARYIGIDLLRRFPQDHGWGYKDLEEREGAPEVDCALRLLDLVPDATNAEWREHVRAFHSKKREKVKLDTGSIVKFAHPISFTHGVGAYDTFLARKEGRKLRFYPICVDGSLTYVNKHLPVRITNYDMREKSAVYQKEAAKKFLLDHRVAGVDIL